MGGRKERKGPNGMVPSPPGLSMIMAASVSVALTRGQQRSTFAPIRHLSLCLFRRRLCLCGWTLARPFQGPGLSRGVDRFIALKKFWLVAGQIRV